MSTSAGEVADIAALIGAADRAAAGGRQAEAQRLLEEARAAAPDHPLVLNALGMYALKSGEFTRGRHYLESAVRAEPRTPLLWFHLALLCRAQSDEAAELAALERALALDPYFYLALLQKGALLERQDRHKAAASAYSAFLACAPPAAVRAEGLASAVEHARAAIARNSASLEAMLQSRLAPIRARYGSDQQLRFEHCLDVLLGKRRVFTPQPTFMHFPLLPALEFHDRSQFPWLAAFEAATAEMRAELLALLATGGEGMVPYVDYPAGAPLNQWQELNRSRRWSAYYLVKEGARLEDHIARCPRTAALVAAAPLADVPGQAPTAFFSILEPHTRIPPHTGVTNTRLVVHVPLVVPPGCGFRVGSETREWRVGEGWVFDDTIEHEAWNNSSEPRAILIIDTWNPFLSAAERDLVRVATQAVVDYSRD